MGYSSIKSANIFAPFIVKALQKLYKRCFRRLFFFDVFGVIILSILLISCSAPPKNVDHSIVREGAKANAGASDQSRLKSTLTPMQTQTQTQIALSTLHQLPGWSSDTMEDVWPAWLKSCRYLLKASVVSDLKAVCQSAIQLKNPSDSVVKRFFETHFQARQIRQLTESRGYPKDSVQGLVTGYYEPILRGSLTQKGPYQTALYQYPPSWKNDPSQMRPARAELFKSGVLKGLELVWVEDPVAAAVMQIQGSGKIVLENQQVLRLGFAGTNQQTFQSFANWLIQNKEITLSQANMPTISAWAKANPSRIEELLNTNPRFVFFKIIKGGADDAGPIGALGESLTVGRSIAVDWQYISKGVPMFLSTSDPQNNQPLQKLVFAQDTGNAIVGSIRVDYYWGSGDLAGEKAGKTKQAGTVWVLEPILRPNQLSQLIQPTQPKSIKVN